MTNAPVSVGAYGDSIARLQDLLRQRGFQLPTSEVSRKFFGPRTRQAVQQVQQQNGLPITGEVDERTASALNFRPTPSGRQYSEQTGLRGGEDWAKGDKPRIGIVLSGWAPAMTLMSGAMLGFMEKGVEFDVISTSGVGALIGLLSLAPKGKTAKEALEELPNLFVSDLLYSVLPVNFKLFFKFGAFSDPIYQLRKKLPRFPIGPTDPSILKRLANDWIDMACCAMTPTTFTLKSPGLMCHSPQIADLIDFDKLPQSPARFYLNAFDLNKKRVKIFDKDTVNADAYHAAEALPFLFAPQRVGAGNLFTTGATHDPTGLQAIWLKEKPQLDKVIALDPLSAAIWRAPTDIHDAFQLMLMNPILALEVLLFSLYARTDQITESLDRPEVRLPKLYRLPFSIDSGYYPNMLKWTHSNAVKLQEIGRTAAKNFADAMASDVGDAFERDHRFYRWTEIQDRIQEFMRLFPSLRLPDGGGAETTQPARMQRADVARL
jgi:NTE family protein